MCQGTRTLSPGSAHMQGPSCLQAVSPLNASSQGPPQSCTEIPCARTGTAGCPPWGHLPRDPRTRRDRPWGMLGTPSPAPHRLFPGNTPFPTAPPSPATAPKTPLCDTLFLIPSMPPLPSPPSCPAGVSPPLGAPSAPPCPSHPQSPPCPHRPPKLPPQGAPPQPSLPQCSPNPSRPRRCHPPLAVPLSLNVPSAPLQHLRPLALAAPPSAPIPQRSPHGGHRAPAAPRRPPAHRGAGCAVPGRPWRRPGGARGCRWPSPPPPSSPRSNEGEAAGALPVPVPALPVPAPPALALRAARSLQRPHRAAAPLPSAPRGVSGVFDPRRAAAECGRGRGGAVRRLRSGGVGQAQTGQPGG